MKTIAFLSILIPLFSFAYFEHSEDSPAVMNDIRFSDYRDFTTKWKLVTVRFREDSGEIRMTYANDKAFEAMKKLKPDYPDGAAFGKISFLTEGDPAFPSSKVPTDKKRFQLMVRNKRKYNETQGWGYALFDFKGKTFDEDIKQQTLACAACHQLVEERQFVFSRSFHSSIETLKKSSKPEVSSSIVFSQKKPSAFKGIISDHLKDSESWVESLEGKLQKLAFSGTLDEIVPLLVERSKLMGKYSVLFLNPLNFTLVKKIKKNDCLTAQAQKVHILIYFNGGKVRDSEQCL